ncbi:tRNA pseudouridine synthase A 1 isoform X2 [Populus alba x Populus x berolinensis]|nr:tRNA pseudouridine synthase A 1 isoform X2 [Populus alba x Populus x berolinensis]
MGLSGAYLYLMMAPTIKVSFPSFLLIILSSFLSFLISNFFFLGIIIIDNCLRSCCFLYVKNVLSFYLVCSTRFKHAQNYIYSCLCCNMYNFNVLIIFNLVELNILGWQFQQTPPTIQCILEKALTRATKLGRKDLHLVGASRTDGGVHAWGQVAHFVTPFNYDSLDSIHAALNGLLPPDIRVREISAVVPEFHARFSAKGKTYHYKIFNDAVMDPFQRLYAYHVTHKLNAAVMREAANHFIGTHDFSAFVNSSRNDGVPNPVKTIFRFDIIKMGALLQLEVEGSGFMYRQVRNMVALLLQIGKEAIAPDIVPKILSTRDRKELAKYTLAAPPQGLCLVAVKYNEEHLQLPLGCPTTSLGRHHSISKCKVPFY